MSVALQPVRRKARAGRKKRLNIQTGSVTRHKPVMMTRKPGYAPIEMRPVRYEARKRGRIWLCVHASTMTGDGPVTVIGKPGYVPVEVKPGRDARVCGGMCLSGTHDTWVTG